MTKTKVKLITIDDRLNKVKLMVKEFVKFNKSKSAQDFKIELLDLISDQHLLTLNTPRHSQTHLTTKLFKHKSPNERWLMFEAKELDDRLELLNLIYRFNIELAHIYCQLNKVKSKQ